MKAIDVKLWLAPMRRITLPSVRQKNLGRTVVDRRAFLQSGSLAAAGVALGNTAPVAAAETPTADAVEISAFVSTALKTVTDELIPPFERTSGHIVRAFFAPPGALLKHFASGEPADVFLTGREAIDQLIGEGKVTPGRVDLATTGVGICVRKGAPKPDVSTPEAFKRAMLAAKTVGYASPAGGSIVGPHIQKIFAQLGIAEQMAPKTKLSAGGPNGRVSVLVASGEAEIGLQQVTELLSNPDVEVIGMLPADLQQISTYSAGITTTAKDSDAAKALVKAMSAASAAPVYKAKGLEPM
jgi:molybdate transport system substrate-binding protein